MHQLDRLLCKTCFIFRYQKLDRFSVLKTGPFFVPTGPISWLHFAKLSHSYAPFLAPFSMPKKNAVVVPVGAASETQSAKLCSFPISFGVPFTDSRNGQMFIQCVLVLRSHFSQGRATLGCELVANPTRQGRCFLGCREWYVGCDDI